MSIAPWPVVAVRICFVVAGIALWYWTQAVLGKRVPKVAHEVPLTEINFQRERRGGAKPRVFQTEPPCDGCAFRQ